MRIVVLGGFGNFGARICRALACGAHYFDLSDGREFVAGFGAAMDGLARQANRLAVTGARTLPALSSAVVGGLG